MAMCIEYQNFDGEPVTSEPHQLLSLRTRISDEGRTYDFLCTECGRLWIRGVDGWALKPGPMPQYDAAPVWGENS